SMAWHGITGDRRNPVVNLDLGIGRVLKKEPSRWAGRAEHASPYEFQFRLLATIVEPRLEGRPPARGSGDGLQHANHAQRFAALQRFPRERDRHPVDDTQPGMIAAPDGFEDIRIGAVASKRK